MITYHDRSEETIDLDDIEDDIWRICFKPPSKENVELVARVWLTRLIQVLKNVVR